MEISEDDIQPNSAFRMVSKLCLNTLRGYSGLKTNTPKVKLVDNMPEVVDLFTDFNINLHSLDLIKINEKLMIANFKIVDQIDPILPNLSVLLALFTTSHARLILYEHLQKIPTKNILYFDTDSIVYSLSNSEQYPLTEGELMGEFKNELTNEYDEGAYATQFVSSGPKCYAMKIKTSKQGEINKVVHKGIRRTRQSELSSLDSI